MPYSARLLVAACFALLPGYPLVQGLAAAPAALVAQAQTFSVPTEVPAGTALSIQSSPNMGIAAQALQDKFQAAYAGTEVGVDVTSSDQALKALAAGEVDLAAIGRPLTEAEQGQGLVTVPLSREKIAIIIGPDNPFTGNLTFAQFAAMFRGEITDWSEVGGAPGPIRFVDRPETSDTRRSLSQYEVFRNDPFETGATAETMAEDDTAAVIAALGTDGISYAIAPQVLDQPGVKIVPMHQTLPDDPRYPYSQPRYFVYTGVPSAAVAAFLGYATAPQGQEVLAAAQKTEAAAVSGAAPTAETSDPAAAATPVPDPDVTPGPAATPDAAPAPVTTAPAADRRGGFAWWWLLPLLGLGALAWALFKPKGAVSPTAGVEAPPVIPPPPIPPEPDGLPVPPVAQEVIAVEEVSPPLPEEVPLADIPMATEAGANLVTPATSGRDLPLAAPAALGVLGAAGLVAKAAADSSDEATVHEPKTAGDWPVPERSEPVLSGSEVLGAAGLAGAAAMSLAGTEDQSTIEASKFNVVGRPAEGDIDLAGIDDGLPPLPEGYGDSRIVLMPRDPQWAYAYWDTPSGHKEHLRHQGGERLALRLYDVTDINLDDRAPHNMQQFDCDELARAWYLQIPVSDRDYQVEIGYLAGDGRWLVLARSNAIRVPPVYPSDWSADYLMTVGWDENLRGKTLKTLVDPRLQEAASGAMHETMYALSLGGESERMAGSLFGSMQHVPGSMVPSQAVSSYVFASGAGLGMVPGGAVLGSNLSGLNVSGLNVSGLNVSGPNIYGLNIPGLTMSGLNVSGLTMSGVGFSASMPPIRPRQFWLVADAELIVYGATEPDATVTIGGQPIQLSPEGTFRFQTSFQDGTLEYPIMGVAADGEQNRSIHMTFERQTPQRHTNTREEAQEEWPED